MPAAPSETPSARGRNVASKPLGGSAKAKSTASTASLTGNKSSRTPSASSAASSKSSTAGSVSSKSGKQPSTSQASARGSEADVGFKVTKLSSSTVTLNTTWKPKPPAPPAPRATAPPPTTTTDPLQVAAQVYPWTSMSSTLNETFKISEAAATSNLETRAAALAAEESEVADQRDRLEAEHAIAFFDELGSDALAKEAPEIMQLFQSHGDSCARVETAALKLANRTSPISEDEEPLKAYNDMLHDLEELQNQATSLQTSIIKLTEESTSTSEENADEHAADSSSVARSEVNSVFSSCLPVLRARVANLSLAQELIDTALENVTLGLRMESMGLA